MELASADIQPSFGSILFRDEQFFCDHDGALFWPRQNCLIVSDLHLEKGTASATNGVLIPPYDTGETLNQLHICIKRWNPDKVICLGDSFHRDDSESKLPLQYRIQLTNMMKSRDWVWISGNHDPNGPGRLPGKCQDELSFDSVHFRHEQRHYPDDEGIFANQAGEISGHLHPCAIIHRRGKRLRRRCFASDNNRLILPAFGAFTGGLNIFHQAYDGLFDTDNLRVWMMGKYQVYELSGRQLSR